MFMENTTAYHIGQIAGAIFAVLMMVGICVFFVFALVRAFTTRTRGWIIAASISSLPFLVFLILILAGMVMGFSKAVNRSSEMTAARRGKPSELLQAAMTPVSGNALSYQISLPSSEVWGKNDSHPPFDYLFSYRDAYVGVIAEGIGLGTAQKICDLSQTNLASKASSFVTTTPVVLDIDSHSWLTYDATATLTGVEIKYRFYVYADSNCTIQVITWTGPMLFDHYAPIFDRIAKSFKLPK
jgi:hypothetical protein